jgi:aspartate/methionine/tyrosine aminotransferase
VTEPSDRFPVLEHLTWARFQSGRGRHCLSRSQVPSPPPEVFDSSGEMPLVVTPEILDCFKTTIAERYGVAGDEITLTAGVSEALFIVAAGLVTERDRVLVEAPGYQSLAAVYAAQGGRVSPLVRGIDGALAAEPAREAIGTAAAEAARTGGRLGAVVLSDLHNPSGAALDEDTLDAITAACESAGARLVIDEVYRDSDPRRPIGSARNRHPGAITIMSLTKAYGMGGLRAGWISAPPDYTRVFTRIQSYLSVQPSAPSMVLGTRALARGEAILSWARGLVNTNRQQFLKTIGERPGGFICPEPGLGSVVFPYRPGGPDTREEVATWLARDGVEVIPGIFFGAPQGVRIGLGVEPGRFEEAIGKWAVAVSSEVVHGEDSSPGSLSSR